MNNSKGFWVVLTHITKSHFWKIVTIDLPMVNDNFCTIWPENQKINYNFEGNSLRVDGLWVHMGVLFIFLWNSIYDFSIFVIRMLGYRKLGVGQIVSGKGKCRKARKHSSAMGRSDSEKYQEWGRSMKVTRWLDQPTEGEPTLNWTSALGRWGF